MTNWPVVVVVTGIPLQQIPNFTNCPPERWEINDRHTLWPFGTCQVQAPCLPRGSRVSLYKQTWSRIINFTSRGFPSDGGCNGDI